MATNMGRIYEDIGFEINDEISYDNKIGIEVENGSEDEEEQDGNDDAPIEENGSKINGHYGDNTLRALCDDNFPGIAGLIRQMPNLEVPDLNLREVRWTVHFVEADLKHGDGTG